MLTPKQVKVLGAFLKQPYEEKTYRDIKGYAKENSNSVIQKALLAYLEEGLVEKRDVGNIILYRLNLKSKKTLSYLGILSEESLPKTAKQALRIIREETADIPFKAVVVFGSYAEGTQKEKSDLDIAIFVRNAEDKKKAVLSLKEAEMKSLLHLDAHAFTREEMLQMLKDKEENLGKQIARKHLAIQNPEIFYAIVEEGIANGFVIVPEQGRK